jgi:hypothetical protein
MSQNFVMYVWMIKTSLLGSKLKILPLFPTILEALKLYLPILEPISMKVSFFFKKRSRRLNSISLDINFPLINWK